MRLICFGRAMQNGGTFHSFFEEEIGKLLAKNSKNSKNTTQWMT